MFLSETLRHLNLYSDTMYQNCRTIIKYNRTDGRLSAHNTTNIAAQILGPTILTTVLTMPEIKFKIRFVSVNRQTLSSTNLENTTLTPKSNEAAEREQLRHIAMTISHYGFDHLETEDRCCIYVIKTPSGLSNLKKWLAKANYEPLAILLTTYTDHKVDVYKILNAVFIVTNDLSAVDYTSLLGYLPILFKEAYTTLNTYPDLYAFYKTIYSTKKIDTLALKSFTCYKDLEHHIRNSNIDKALADIEQNLVSTLDSRINNTKTHINSLEQELAREYNNLNTAIRIKSTNLELANKDLILMCLKNNPNIIDVSTNECYCTITTYGPVDYDRTAMKSTLKRKPDFVQWLLTTTEYTLCWESECIINITENTVKIRQNQNSKYGHIRNTHWHRYTCLGNNRTPIIKALIQQDYLSAFSQIITAAQLLNAYDITVLDGLIADLTYDRYDVKAFIKNDTGEMYSTREMSAIFKKIKESEAATNAE